MAFSGLGDIFGGGAFTNDAALSSYESILSVYATKYPDGPNSAEAIAAYNSLAPLLASLYGSGYAGLFGGFLTDSAALASYYSAFGYVTDSAYQASLSSYYASLDAALTSGFTVASTTDSGSFSESTSSGTQPSSTSQDSSSRSLESGSSASLSSGSSGSSGSSASGSASKESSGSSKESSGSITSAKSSSSASESASKSASSSTSKAGAAHIGEPTGPWKQASAVFALVGMSLVLNLV